MDYYQPPVPPHKAKNRKLVGFVLAGCGTLIVIALLLAVFASKILDSFAGPGHAVEVHLDALNKSNLDAAYDGFTVNYRRNHSLEDFQLSLSPFATHLPLQNAKMKHVTVKEESAVVEGMLTGRDGVLFPASYRLIREAGDWKIESFEWQSPGETQSI